ncbi:prefoldin subunit 4 [Trichomonascus vanleenenianus]|uniref:tubulin-binding prefolding complex subunit GIM3 n=1 Tax=Trichomonascus vanleenenianus TaxID=2268995 RepID=UPI003ECB2B8E
MEILPEGQKNEVDVVWADQQRINEFSKLNSRLDDYEDELKKFRDEKEYIEDVMMEMELVDEEESVQYKIGDAFVFLLQPEVIERLEQESAKVNKLVTDLETKVETVESRMTQLKKELYAKFGNAINLERN